MNERIMSINSFTLSNNVNNITTRLCDRKFETAKYITLHVVEHNEPL